MSEQLSALENRLLAPITSAGSAGSGGSSPTTGNLGFLDVTGETVLHKNVIADNINGDQGQERIRFSETGGLNMHTWLGAAMHFDLTNINNSAKRGLTMDVRSTKNSPLANVGGIAISQYSLPDTGGDTSAIWLGQSGGGNALSVFNLSALTPPGYQKYPNNGFAIEAGVDGGKHSILSSVESGIAFYGLVGGSNGAGVSIFPAANVVMGPYARAFRVANADNSVEKFYVNMDGAGFFGGGATIVGKLCLTKSDGTPVCITAGQLATLLAQ